MNLDEIAGSILHRARVEPTRIPNAVGYRVAFALYGEASVTLSPMAQVAGSTATILGRKRIVLKRGMSVARSHFTVAQMVARIELSLLRCWSSAHENELAACILAPREHFAPTLAEDGLHLDALAARYAVPETCAALRVVEVGARDGLVVTPARVYRKATALSWVSDEGARALARARQPRSVRRVAISDEPGRVALYRAA